MATKARAARRRARPAAAPGRGRRERAREIREIVNQGAALQVELLGAAIKVWSTVFESMAAYVKSTSEEVLGLTTGGDANAVVDKVMKTARDKLEELTDLPEHVATDFARKVRARAKG